MNWGLSKKLIIFCTVLCLTFVIPGCTQPASSGGILKVGMSSDAINIGYPADQRSSNDYFMCRPAVESLGRFDATGNFVPFLATGWQTDATAKTMTVTLRKGIKFHDGTDFNAEACKWNLEQFIAAKRAELIQLKSVDIVDAYTVRLNLNNWDNAIVMNVAYYGGPMISPTAFKQNGKDWCIKNPVGTGPFKFVSWQRDVSVKYTKFTGYWQKDKPYLDGVELIIIKDPMTMLAAIKGKEVNIVKEISPKDAVTFAPPDYEVVKLKTGLGAALFSLIGDSVHPNSPFSKIKVRQAIGHAVDSKGITDSLLFGYGVPANQWALPGYWAYNPDVKGQPYDANKAKQLLSEAGYPGGLKTTLTVPSIPDFVTQMTAVQGYLVKSGIDAQLNVVDFGKFNEMTRVTGWENGLMLGFSKMDGDPVAQMPNIFSTGGLVYTKSLMHPEPLEKLLSTARGAPDAATKKKYALELQKMIYDEYTITTPLYVVLMVTVKSSKSHNDGVNVIESTEWTPEEAWMSP